MSKYLIIFFPSSYNLNKVRVLGNGRPFALEVIEAKDVLTNELLSQVVRHI